MGRTGVVSTLAKPIAIGDSMDYGLLTLIIIALVVITPAIITIAKLVNHYMYVVAGVVVGLCGLVVIVVNIL